MAEATFTVTDEGLPIHKDVTVTLRPRLFLEGNFFLDVQPGSPSAPDLSSGATIPVTQTQTAVQIDQILTALQSNTRQDLRRALIGYGKAVNQAPTAAQDATQDPDVQGLTGGEAINQSFRYGGKAGRTTAIVNQAFLGQHPHDLSALVRAQRDLFAQLASTDGSLSDLITNFNTTTGALAAESANLSASIRELAPTLEVARPSLRPPERRPPSVPSPGSRVGARAFRSCRRRFAPAHRGSCRPPSSCGPRELGGTAKELEAAAPGLANVTHKSLKLFPQLGQASKCVSQNLIPTGDTIVDDAGGAYPFSTGQPNYREFFYGAAQLAGESQGFDGNGPFVRFQTGGGPTLVSMPNPSDTFQAHSLWAHNISPPLATRPRLPAGGSAAVPDGRSLLYAAEA